MRVMLREVVFLGGSIVVVAGSENSAPKPLAISPKTLPSPHPPPPPRLNFPSTRERPLAIDADKMILTGKTVRYQGDVRWTTDCVITSADTQSAKATGKVAIRMRLPRSFVVPLGQ